MKAIFIIFALSFALLYSHSSFAQSVDSATGPKAPTVRVAEAQPPVGRRNPTMDGLTFRMGVFSPFHDEMKGIYGSAFALSGRYCLNMSKSTDLLASVGLVRKDGDPYHDVPTFSSGRASTIQFVPMELSMRRRMVFMRDQSSAASRGLYAGAGINYVRAEEEIPGILSASGGDFGAQIFAGPQIFFAENFAFEGEVKLLMSQVDMKHEDEMYTITLSGLLVTAALSWYF